MITAVTTRDVTGHCPGGFTVGETEAQSGSVICPRSLHKSVPELGFDRAVWFQSPRPPPYRLADPGSGFCRWGADQEVHGQAWDHPQIGTGWGQGARVVRRHCLALFSTPEFMVTSHIRCPVATSLQALSPISAPLRCRGIWEAEETRNYPQENGGMVEHCLF